MGLRTRHRGEHPRRLRAPAADQGGYAPAQAHPYREGRWVHDPVGGRRVKRISIGLRLTLWYLVIFALAQALFGVGMWYILRQNLRDIADRTLENTTEDVRRFLEARPGGESLPELQKAVADEYGSETGGDYLQITDSDGNWVYRAPALAQQGVAAVAPALLEKRRGQDVRLGKEPFRLLAEKIDAGGRTYVVQVGTSMDEEAETLQQFRDYLLMFAPLLLLLAGMVGYGLSRRALAPVDALTRTARTITGGTLGHRLAPLHTGDELPRLSDTLNEMLARLEAAFGRVTQFTADASHELRTPVSLIRTEAELALRRSRGEAEYKESLQHILVEAERTTALIEQLLALARADSGRETLHLQQVDLRQTLSGVVDGWQRVAAIRDLKFAAQIADQSALVMGDETLLRRLVDILLDNA